MKKLVFIIVSLLLSLSLYAQDKTLRIDYIFSGTDKTQEIALDEMSSFDGWAGRRVNMDEVPVRGNGQIVMTDKANGEVLYRQSFSTLFQEWQTTEEATRVRKSFENVFLLPMPSVKAIVTVELYGFKGGVSASMTHEVDPSDILIRKLSPDGAKEADAKRLISLMSLGARKGDTITFFINGPDEREAAEKLHSVCRESVG